MTLQARPTTYNGIPMRSRLEARYAARLDEKGYTWLYEPRAYASPDGQYLPDFQILAIPEATLDYLAFIEVRPTVDALYRAPSQMQIILASEPDAWLFAVIPWEFGLYSEPGNRTWRVTVE